MTKADPPSPANRIVGFTSLAEYEDGVVEGRVRIEAVAGVALRRVWRDGEWWHSVVDVIAALTESVDAGTYWRVLKKRLRAEGSEAVTDCNGLRLPAADGKMRVTDCATAKTLVRVIQSVS